MLKISYSTSKTIFSCIALGALAVQALWLWQKAFAFVFESWFLWDDPRFRAVAPPSFGDLLVWFGTAADENGYYRPFSRLLWSWTTAFGASDFSDFQRVTMVMLAGAVLCLYYAISRLFGNKPVALAAACGFALAGVHLKPMFWTTVWFHEASCLFAAANLALMVMHYRKNSAWPRTLSLCALFLAYSTNNALHSWALVPLAVDLVFLKRNAGERMIPWLRRFFWVAKDHLLLSLTLFTYIYVLHDPFEQARDIVGWAPMIHIKAVGFYVGAAIAHLWGDGQAYTEYPNWLLALSALTLGTGAVGFLFDRRMLIGSAVLVGTVFVIALLYGRWQVEYAIPVAMAVAVLLGGAVSLVIQKLPQLGWLIAPAWIYGAYFVTSALVAPMFVQGFLPDADVSRAFVESITKLDREVEPGRIFVLNETRGERLQSAANGHFVPPSAALYIPGRAFFVDSRVFQTGEKFGLSEISGEKAQEILKLARPPFYLSCGDYGCEPGRKP